MAVLAVVVLAGCSDDDPDPTPQHRPLVALLVDGRLMSGTTARLGKGVRLTTERLRPMSGRLVAVTPDRRLVAVLLASTRSEVVVLTARGLRVRARIRLPLDRRTRAAAVVAPVPDRLVVLGEQKVRSGGEVPVGWVLDVRSGTVVERWRVPKAPDRNWTVFDAAAAPDRLYVSYHGGCSPGRPQRCTTGADFVSWQTGEPLCAQADRVPAGCLREIHGEVAALEEGALGTGGVPLVLRADADARIAQRWQSRLERNHLMRLAYDAASRRVFVLGSCLYAGGLARIDLDGGWKWRRGIATDARPSLCGERISAGGGLVVFTDGPEWVPSGESDITVVNAETGSVRARLPIAAPAVDVALVG